MPRTILFIIPLSSFELWLHLLLYKKFSKRGTIWTILSLPMWPSLPNIKEKPEKSLNTGRGVLKKIPERSYFFQYFEVLMMYTHVCSYTHRHTNFHTFFVSSTVSCIKAKLRLWKQSCLVSQSHLATNYLCNFVKLLNLCTLVSLSVKQG